MPICQPLGYGIECRKLWRIPTMTWYMNRARHGRKNVCCSENKREHIARVSREFIEYSRLVDKSHKKEKKTVSRLIGSNAPEKPAKIEVRTPRTRRARAWSPGSNYRW